MRIAVAILAAGQGTRFGGDKTQILLAGKPLWRWSFETFLGMPEVSDVGLVGSAVNLASMRQAAPAAAFVVLGGASRQESSAIGLAACGGVDIVLIHDAARPFASRELVLRVIEGVRKRGASAPGIPAVDTLRIQDDGGYRLLDRSKIVAMQTPQGGLRDVLAQAHLQASEEHTDELALVDAAGLPYEIVPGDPENFKITTPDDLKRAEAMLGPIETRTGLGYDIHAFSRDAGRRLMLGGVFFEEELALEGHSDADVILHAAVDALLGAAALGDIGQHFSNTDPQWKGEPSVTFLKHAGALLHAGGWRIVNLDVAVMAERPKIMPRALEMRQAIGAALDMDVDRVSIKATTNEGLGAIGRGEGIAAYATATIARP